MIGMGEGHNSIPITLVGDGASTLFLQVSLLLYAKERIGYY